MINGNQTNMHFIGKLLKAKEKELKVKAARVYENNEIHWTTFSSDTTDDSGECTNIVLKEKEIKCQSKSYIQWNMFQEWRQNEISDVRIPREWITRDLY